MLQLGACGECRERVVADESVDDVGNLNALVLLQEVARVLDGDVLLASGARHARLDVLVGTACDRVLVAEGWRRGPTVHAPSYAGWNPGGPALGGSKGGGPGGHALLSQGRLKVASTSQALRFSAADGASGEIGTSSGNTLAPAWYLPLGYGAP